MVEHTAHTPATRPPDAPGAGAADPLGRLSEAGVSVWLDDLSRRRLQSGDLAELIETRHVVGVTSNPTIFAAAVAEAADYADQLDALAHDQVSVAEAVRAVTVEDVRRACDLLHDVWRRTGGQDGRVSLEVDPRLASDTDATVAEARQLWAAVDRPNLLVKIPATEAGLPAITRALADGISVNVTLIFSVDRYRQVQEAFLTGMEHARVAGHDLTAMASVASFFVSRVDAEIDSRLEQIDTPAAVALRGQAAVANARLAYAAYQDMIGTDRWARLAHAGARPQRPLWASTGVKDPAYPDTRYVTEIAAPNTVNTMPAATLDAYADHGDPHGDQVTGTATHAATVFAALASVSVDLDDVYRALEDDGVARFAASWQQVEDTVADQLDRRR